MTEQRVDFEQPSISNLLLYDVLFCFCFQSDMFDELGQTEGYDIGIKPFKRLFVHQLSCLVDC